MLADELNIVVHSDYLAARVGLDVPLRNLSRLVVEQPMRVSSPGHTPHVHSISDDKYEPLAMLTQILAS